MYLVFHVDVKWRFLEDIEKGLVLTLKKHPYLHCKKFIKCGDDDDELFIFLCIYCLSICMFIVCHHAFF